MSANGGNGGSKRPRAEEEDPHCEEAGLTPDEEEAVAAAEREAAADPGGFGPGPFRWEFDHENQAALDWESKKRRCLHMDEADIARGPRRGLPLTEDEKKRAVEAHRARRALRREIEVDAWIHEAEPLAPVELDARWRNALAERTIERLAARRARRLVALSRECAGAMGIDAHMQYMKAVLHDTSQDYVARATSEIADKIGDLGWKVGEVSTSLDALASATSDVANEIKDHGDAEAGLRAVAKSIDDFGELYERLK